MDERATLKSRAKLGVMREKLIVMKSVETLQPSEVPDVRLGMSIMETAWTDFITAAGVFVNTLEQGAKNNSRSNEWFLNIKKTRREDPLLRYLHQSRNTEQHGLQNVTLRSISQVSIPPGGRARIASIPGHKNALAITPEFGTTLEYQGAAVTLIPVKTRKGETIGLPQQHLGNKIDSSEQRPRNLAELALNYFETILLEAESLVNN